MRDAGIPVAGLFLASALSLHLLYWWLSSETSVAVLGVYGRQKAFFQAGFCVSAAMPLLGLEEQEAELLFGSLYECEGCARCC